MLDTDSAYSYYADKPESYLHGQRTGGSPVGRKLMFWHNPLNGYARTPKIEESHLKELLAIAPK
jgi:hypothetical protein